MKKRKSKKPAVKLTPTQIKQLKLLLDALEGKYGPEAEAIVRAQLKPFGRGNMSKRDLQNSVTLKELLVSSLPAADAVAKLLIQKAPIITEQEFNAVLMTERATYQAMLGGKRAN